MEMPAKCSLRGRSDRLPKRYTAGFRKAVQLHGRLGADSWEASAVLDPDVKMHEWP